MIATDNLVYDEDIPDCEYSRFRYLFIKATEGVRYSVYLDSSKEKNPTIGIGFNLRNKKVLTAVLSTFKITDPTDIDAFYDLVKAPFSIDDSIQNALDTKFAQYPIAEGTTFVQRSFGFLRTSRKISYHIREPFLIT